jgi:integrase
MRGNIRKKADRTWEVSVELDRDPETGRRRRRWERVYGTKKDAEARLAQLLHEQETGLSVDPSRLTVAAWLREWFAQKAPHLRPTTRDRYRVAIEQRLIPAFGRVRLQELRPAQVQGVYARWLAEGLAGPTVNSWHRVLAGALREAVRLQLVGRAVTDAVRPPSATPHNLQLKPADAPAVLRSLEAVEQPWRAFCLLILYTGMRRGEALGLQWPDVDLERGVAAITRTRTTTRSGELVEGPPKTKAGERAVPLPAPAVEALREWRREQVEDRLAAGATWEGGEWVFATRGGPIHPHTPTHWWRDHARQHGLALRLHDLRHLAATIMAQTGIPPRVAAQVLGHTRPSFTLDVYAGAPDFEAMRQAVEALSKAYQGGA